MNLMARFLLLLLVIPLLSAQQSKTRVGIGVSEPMFSYAPDPDYPKAAKEHRIKGNVAIMARIDDRGCVIQAKLIRKLGYGLDEEALRVIRYWKFKATLPSGKPVPKQFVIEINFDPDRPGTSPIKPTDQPCSIEAGD
jgi:TonB family protein